MNKLAGKQKNTKKKTQRQGSRNEFAPQAMQVSRQTNGQQTEAT